MWLSLVERCVRDAEAVGSNPVTPIDLRKVGEAGKYSIPGFFVATFINSQVFQEGDEILFVEEGNNVVLMHLPLY